MKKNIVLIGFMCTGKTTIGKLVSQKLNFKFIDTDLEIKKNSGLEIDRIFEIKGEEYFRHLETLVIDEASALSRTVISCGGGVVKNKSNIDMLKRNGIIFCLKSDIDTIYKRIRSSVDIRPLAKGKSKRHIQGLMEEREILYTSSADFFVDTRKLSIMDIVDEIIHVYNGKAMY